MVGGALNVFRGIIAMRRWWLLDLRVNFLTYIKVY